MAEKKKQNRDVSVSFTKINEDILVPTRLINSKKSLEEDRRHPLKRNSIIWYGLAIFWFVSILIMPPWTKLFGIAIATGLVLLLAIGWYLSTLIPTFWMEFNRTDGYVTCWSSPKKKKQTRREHIDNLVFKVARRMYASPRDGENRFYIDLTDKNSGKIFCTLFTLFSDDKVLADPSWDDFAIAGALNHRVENFIRTFMKGQPLPVSSTSTYSFSPGEAKS
jgi:hypothetical protein